MKSLITHLQQLVSLGSDPAEIESNKRSSAVEKLSSDLEKYESRFYALITGNMDGDIESASSPRLASSSSGSHVQETQAHVDQLDHILGTATHLKEIGYEINDEIGVHVGLLEEIEDRENQLLSKQRRNEMLMREWKESKTSSMTFVWGLVVLLFFALFYVLMH